MFGKEDVPILPTGCLLELTLNTSQSPRCDVHHR